MNRSMAWRMIVFVLAVLWLVSGVDAAGTKKPQASSKTPQKGALGSGKKEPDSKSKPKYFAVIQVGQELRVISKSDVSAEKKRVEDKYKQDTKTYQDARKEAIKNKDENVDNLEKPIKPVVKVLRNSFKSEDTADDFIDKYLEDHSELTAASRQPTTTKRRG